MARKIRIEYAGAYYHVINRGNYRSWIFESEGAVKSFVDCLQMGCESQGWRIHAWVLMGNHYHLCLETPKPNLVEGMSWIQSTFANRFNRFRKSNGHVFQGRYKAILLDANAIGPVSHYIHLNPVRAGIVDAANLHNYKRGSFRQLWYPRSRWDFSVFETALESAGGLVDNSKGRSLYRDYLAWLSEEDIEKKRIGYDSLSRGWAIGTKEFKKAIIDDLKNNVSKKVVESEAAELRESRWERAFRALLQDLGYKESDLISSRKGEAWKVAIARLLRDRYLVPNTWIAKRLQMGAKTALKYAGYL